MSEESQGTGAGNDREGLGVLAALKDVLEEAIAEAREKGGPGAERAREAMRTAMDRARVAAGEARGRLDVATEREVRELREQVGELRVRLENLERRASQDPSAGPSRSSEEEVTGGG